MKVSAVGSSSCDGVSDLETCCLAELKLLVMTLASVGPVQGGPLLMRGDVTSCLFIARPNICRAEPVPFM